MRVGKVWIVEMLNEKSQRWEPTYGADLGRADARMTIRRWRANNPDDKFRIATYVPEKR